ncbi:zinc finger protein OZF-like isoform X6 [Micropterus salmoides]|uniref:zinc finger protein OZF-like isoform X5 n=1 Tax=Micropterus salmoides TaxID=27706 RepID=UPI0018EC53B0|nr:zinc finger protein OZF-like isoform X5 [Micropterus salmoides]XP_038571080.1 zinc finger protein OZF-like isoform X6 [Micropterus salmoides]
MSKVQTLRAFVQQRLSAAAEEIFELFERTIAEYEEELCGQRKLLDAVFKPEADVQLLLVSKEEVPLEQQEWSLSLDQEDPPEPPYIKEEQKELWTSQKGEQLRGLEEADTTKVTFTPVLVKSEEDNKEKPQSSQLHQRLTEQEKTDADGEDCGGPELARNSDPDRPLQPDTEDVTSETREPQSCLNLLQNNSGCITGEKPFGCSECDKRFYTKSSLRQHMKIHTGQKPFSCSVCGKRFFESSDLIKHFRVHTGEKPFSCPVCKNRFSDRSNLYSHMKIHTGEKPFSCSVCGKRFAQRSSLTKHFRVHTGEKPFSCSDCTKCFSARSNLSKHMRVHTGEKPFSCSLCGRRFTKRSSLTSHLNVHTGKKTFSCSVCKTSFDEKSDLSKHIRMHAGKKLCSSSLSGKKKNQLAVMPSKSMLVRAEEGN